jgi:hypothetical protein
VLCPLISRNDLMVLRTGHRQRFEEKSHCLHRSTNSYTAGSYFRTTSSKSRLADRPFALVSLSRTKLSHGFFRTRLASRLQVTCPVDWFSECPSGVTCTYLTFDATWRLLLPCGRFPPTRVLGQRPRNLSSRDERTQPGAQFGLPGFMSRVVRYVEESRRSHPRAIVHSQSGFHSPDRCSSHIPARPHSPRFPPFLRQ